MESPVRGDIERREMQFHSMSPLQGFGFRRAAFRGLTAPAIRRRPFGALNLQRSSSPKSIRYRLHNRVSQGERGFGGVGGCGGLLFALGLVCFKQFQPFGELIECNKPRRCAKIRGANFAQLLRNPTILAGRNYAASALSLNKVCVSSRSPAPAAGRQAFWRWAASSRSSDRRRFAARTTSVRPSSG
jgi:hypothetical protein